MLCGGAGTQNQCYYPPCPRDSESLQIALFWLSASFPHPYTLVFWISPCLLQNGVKGQGQSPRHNAFRVHTTHFKGEGGKAAQAGLWGPKSSFWGLHDVGLLLGARSAEDGTKGKSSHLGKGEGCQGLHGEKQGSSDAGSKSVPLMDSVGIQRGRGHLEL